MSEIPESITRSRVESDPEIIDTLFNYVNERDIEFGEAERDTWPIGLQRLFFILNLDWLTHNGGLEGYLGNRADIDGELDGEVRSALAALQDLGASSVADIVAQAISLWIECHAANTEHGVDLNLAAAAERFSSLSSAYYKAAPQMVLELERYVRAHPEEFCTHPKP